MSDIDHEYTCNIVCPYCGSEDKDGWELLPDGEDLGLIACGDCGKEFYVTRNIRITYSTQQARYGICRKCGKADTPIIGSADIGRDLDYLFPFEDHWWRPTPNDRIRELVKAGALVAAEIDRLEAEEARNANT